MCEPWKRLLEVEAELEIQDFGQWLGRMWEGEHQPRDIWGARAPTNGQKWLGLPGMRSGTMGGVKTGMHSDTREGLATLARTAVGCRKNHRPHSGWSLFTHQILVLSPDMSWQPLQWP